MSASMCERERERRRDVTEKHRKTFHFELFVLSRITTEINERYIVLARYKNLF